MNILGISAFYHDSAAALIIDGKICAAAQEERFTRRKHDEGFPIEAIQYCLRHGGLTPEDIDYLVYYEKPLSKFERLLETYVAFAPAGFRSFRLAIPQWAGTKLFLDREIRKQMAPLGKLAKAKIVYTQHHESHAASAFFPSPYEEAAILTVDGVGEWATTTIGAGTGNRIQLLREQRFPHSLGLLYSAFTHYAGFKVNSGEYKLMGLAPYGEPLYADLIEKHLIDLKDDGSFHLDMSYFNYCQGLTMTHAKFHTLFGRPPRQAEADITQFDMDIAASIQQVTEKAMLRIARHARQLTGKKNLVLAGGVALNCVANGKILRDGAFENVWIQPAAGDAGGALGAALFTWHQLLNQPRSLISPDHQQGSLLGPDFSDAAIADYLQESGAVSTLAVSDADLAEKAAALIASENVVGWFQGRMEFGPRALGARSILGDPRSPAMQKQMNLKIKFRESFRPFAPCVLREHVHEIFQMKPDEDSPYMLLVADIQPSQVTGDPAALKAARGLEKLPIPRSALQAITHVDYSARVQTVDDQRNPLLYQLIKAFHRLTGCPVIINTSFNVRSEPIVCTPQEAHICFLATNMDVLVLGRHILLKKDQPQAGTIDIAEHLAKFALD